MRGGHFVYGVCRINDNGLPAPPNVAYLDEDQAQATADTEDDFSTSKWTVITIWVPIEEPKLFDDRPFVV